DRVLRENFANDPNEPNRPLNVVVEPLGNLRMKVRVERWDGEKDVVLKEWTTILPPDSQVALVTKSAEDWSRTRFVELLKGLDFAAEERLAAGEASIPEEIQEEGRQLNVVSQYAVVRKLHAEIAEHGESPQLLSGLARSYALLGSLTDYFWSTSPKAFEARALLYAERGLQADPKNAEALRTRAFARALVGLHSDALADLKQAEAQDPDGEASPEIAAIAAYCKWDLDALEELAEDQSVRALALYLRMRAIDAFSTEEERDAAARQVTAVCPDCMRACEVIARDASLRVSRMICSGQNGAFAGAVYGRIAANKLVPDNVAKKMPAGPKSADEQQPRIEIPRRVTLVKQLRRAGTPANDMGEPSLSVLASLIQDTSFVHAWRMMELSASKLGYDDDATLNVLKPLIADHPFALFIEEYRWNKTQSLTGKMLLATPYIEFDTFAAPCIEIAGSNFAQGRVPLLREIQNHRDQIFRDLVQVPLATEPPRGFGDRVWQAWTNRGATPVSLWLRKLQVVSPYSAALVGLVITYDWDQTKQRAAEWEQQYDDHASILGALADAYIRNGQPDDAERCLKRVIELHPHQSEYRRLAELYQQEGNTELWLSTLKDSLQAQAQGLETAQTCVEITQHLMREGKAKEARPFAERAGQSYSSWGLTCAAECCDALGDWDAANEYYRRNSQRYEGTDIIRYR
ncbi:MAG TPA: tetratricopeptide repeat protein, partial [Planctomycetaceae bacterium]|nr:tetratricopeptide repeat protein [Planctomycetaceae bacterium]